MLFICGISEIVGLCAYYEVFRDITATGCCGIISDSFDSDNGGLCNENDFMDGSIDHIIDKNGNRICVIEQEPCDRKFDLSEPLSTCFTNINNTDLEVVGNFNISDLCSPEAIEYEEQRVCDIYTETLCVLTVYLFVGWRDGTIDNHNWTHCAILFFTGCNW